MSSNLDQYLQYAECYFQTEAQCIEFLNNRATSEVDAFDDKGGHQQLRLGHDHMTLKLRASEDNAVVDILKKEANEMWLDFTHRVGDYCGSAGKGKHSPDVENIVTETEFFVNYLLRFLQKIRCLPGHPIESHQLNI